RLAHSLGAGNLKLSGTMPSGHVGTLMPQRMYFIEESTATLDGLDLGRPTRCHQNPSIGAVSLPARGILATGMGTWKILDHSEYERTRRETDTPPRTPPPITG
ncbi:MAG TPA: hypothetical protein VL179_16130, partial [Mycobacterium sp.]|nr:hypothetical protein [Mycobacterium sp.]